jgi:hypothetical protein
MPSTIINVHDAEEQLMKLNKQIKQAMNDPSRKFVFFLFVNIYLFMFCLALVVKRKANAQVIIQIDDFNQFSVRLNLKKKMKFSIFIYYLLDDR